MRRLRVLDATSCLVLRVCHCSVSRVFLSPLQLRTVHRAVAHRIRPAAPLVLACLVGAIHSQSATAQLQRSPVIGSTVKPESVTDEVLHLPLDQADARQIDLLLAELGSAEFARRKSARNDFVRIGAPALAKLRDAYRTSTDLDVRLSLEQIIRTVFLNHHLLDSNAFLGISQRPLPVTNENDPRVPRGGVGIVVASVIPDTAAEQFGLQVGDMIVRLDGEPISARRRGFGRAGFGESIRRRAPGTQVVLTLVRGRDTIEVEVALGRRPEYLYGERGFRAELFEVRERFAIWWDKFVRVPADDALDASDR